MNMAIAQLAPELDVTGNYIGIELIDGGRIARLHITPDGKEFLSEHANIAGQDPDSEILFDRDHTSLLWDLFDDIHGNSEVRLLDNKERMEIGALTDAPIFAMHVEYDQFESMSAIGDTYWFPDYAVRSELEELLIEGFVDFIRAD